MKEKTFERTLAGNSTESEGRNNYVKIRGIIKKGFHYSHEYEGKLYYRTEIFVKRESSEIYDVIPVFIQKKELACSYKDKFVEATGILGSYDSHLAKGEHHLHVFFSADTISIVDESKGFINEVYLQGNVCKNIRIKTKKSGETFAQFFIVLSRKNEIWKYYIPCSSFHNLKDFEEENIKAGNEITIKGTFSSKKYTDPLDGKRVNMYEVKCREIYVR